MFKHLFKLIWNKKKQNSLLITEMFVSFLVLYAVFTLVVYCYHNYRQPMGFNHKNVWAITFQIPEQLQRNDSVALFTENIRNTVLSMPQIADVSFTGMNVPFAMSTNINVVGTNRAQRVRTNSMTVEPSYKDVLQMQIQDGRWFTKADEAGKLQPIVINQKLKEELFGKEDAVGKVVRENNIERKIMEDRFRVIGVVANTKIDGDYEELEPSLYLNIDSGSRRWNNLMLVKVKETADAAFESKLFKTLANITGGSIEIEHLEKKLVSKNKLALVPMIIMLIVGGFLIINVALGLFGVLWYNINKRRGEIGLRRAIGASGGAVSGQLVGEALVLATLSLLVGLFFAVQFPLLHVFDLPASVYISAILLSAISIYVLVFLCALYPGKQAAAIYPAVALHEE